MSKRNLYLLIVAMAAVVILLLFPQKSIHEPAVEPVASSIAPNAKPAESGDMRTPAEDADDVPENADVASEPDDTAGDEEKTLELPPAEGQ